MRVSVTITDEMNNIFMDLAKEQGLSKDKVMGAMLTSWLQENGHLEGGSPKPKKVHNERGAGRKREFSDAHIVSLKKCRADGLTYKEIAELFNCSIGIVHKLINEN